MHKIMSERPRGGGEVLHQIFGREVMHAIKKWTQSNLKFCKNEGSIRSKTNKKRGPIGSKIEMKIDAKWRKLMQNP